MKLYVEIVLIIFLVILMYVKSQSLNVFAQSILGKITLVITVLLITTQYGRNAGVLSAVIFMLLLHTSYEGIAKYPPKEKKKPVEDKKKPEDKKKDVIQKALIEVCTDWNCKVVKECGVFTEILEFFRES